MGGKNGHHVKRAIEMKEDILTGDFNGIAKTMEKGWIAKKQTSLVISNPSIEEDYKFAISHGAKACKISGAGGGGFMIIWCDPIDRFSLIKALNERGKGSARPIQFEERGMQAWTLY